MSRVEPLTDRELEVLALLRERLSNKEIAHMLGLSTSDREALHRQPLREARRRQTQRRRDQGRSPRHPSSSLTSSCLLVDRHHLFVTLFSPFW